jgi:hypothetical protein
MKTVFEESEWFRRAARQSVMWAIQKMFRILPRMPPPFESEHWRDIGNEGI